MKARAVGVVKRDGQGAVAIEVSGFGGQKRYMEEM